MAQINSYAVSSLKLNDKILASDADTGVTKNITPAEIIANNPFQYQIGQYLQSQGGVIAHRWLSSVSLGTPTRGTVQNY